MISELTTFIEDLIMDELSDSSIHGNIITPELENLIEILTDEIQARIEELQEESLKEDEENE
jgi:hypothetical protein